MITSFHSGSATLMDAEELHERLSNPARLAKLRASGLLEEGVQSEVLDRLTGLAARLLGVPAALVSLVDAESQRFPGMHGVDNWAGEQRGTPLSYSFCKYVVGQNAPLVVTDASQHPQLKHNRGHTELDAVGYAGVPLRAASGECLGAFCAVHTEPVAWTADQLAILQDLAHAAMAEIELRSTLRELADLQSELEKQAHHDDLTGLLNRRGFSERARHHLALAQRTVSPFTLVALDLDHFKDINDRLGHDMGDAALVELASVLQSVARDSDLVGRLGGDEFAVLLTNTAERAAERFRERLEQELARLAQSPERTYILRSSIGMATWLPESPASIATLHRLADEAMYLDKGARRGGSLPSRDRLTPA